MKRKKINFFAIFGLAVAIGTVAFTAPKVNPENDGLNWFVKDQVLGTYSYDPSGAPEGCPDTGELFCAKGFTTMPVIVDDNTITPHKRYIEE